MEVKLVYRILRGISDWALVSFFSEVKVEGGNHVSDRAPVIFAPSHHNEILDIATLSATAPHRRIIAYWAKSSLFKNPIIGSIMTSSGAIPVRRGGSSGTSSGEGNDRLGDDAARAELYGGTVRALRNKYTDSGSQSLRRRQRTGRGAKPGVVGIFPEGTSYTEPRIVQVKEGIAWAALEVWRAGMNVGTYALEIHDLKDGVEAESDEAAPLLVGVADDEVVIVPVGIVYTNKSSYRSRIYVRYGEPIRVSSYFSQIPRPQTSLSSSDMPPAAAEPSSSSVNGSVNGGATIVQARLEAERTAVRRLTTDIEKAMIKLTVNAPDWDTLYSSRVLRDILFEDENKVPLNEFVEVSQKFIDLLAIPQPQSQSISHLKLTLVRYHALLHYTSITHASLDIIPTHGPPNLTLRDLILPLLLSPLHLLHPSTLLFLPTFPLHLPSYVLASLAKSYIGDPNEEEARAQLMVVTGGLGLGIGYSSGAVGVWKTLRGVLCEDMGSVVKTGILRIVEGVGMDSVRIGRTLETVGGWLGSWVRDWWAGRALGVVGVLWGLSKLHAALIDRNLRLYNRFRALYLLSTSLFFRPLSPSDIAPYLLTPRPAINPFIKRNPTAPSRTEDTIDRFPLPPRTAPQRMVTHLLGARWEAVRAVTEALGRGHEDQMEDGGGCAVGEELKACLRRYGARI